MNAKRSKFHTAHCSSQVFAAQQELINRASALTPDSLSKVASLQINYKLLRAV